MALGCALITAASSLEIIIILRDPELIELINSGLLRLLKDKITPSTW